MWVNLRHLSSVVLLVEADGRRVLMTGDARGDQIVDGLAQAGYLDAADRCHVDVLKLPHQGSARNVTPDFFTQITASKSGEQERHTWTTSNP